MLTLRLATLRLRLLLGVHHHHLSLVLNLLVKLFWKERKHGSPGGGDPCRTYVQPVRLCATGVIS